MIILILSLVVVDVIVLVVATSIPSTRFYSERVLDKEFSAYRNVIFIAVSENLKFTDGFINTE